MTHIFISYSRRDKAIADYIAAQLRNRGADVFIDYQKLVAGENFIGRLGGEIAKADTFVLLVSPRSVESRWVQVEVAWAFNNQKPIIPVLLEAASLQDLFFLINLEQVDFTRWSVDGQVNEAVVKLARALGLPDQPKPATKEPELLVSSDPLEVEEPTANFSVTFARDDLSEIFFTATEVERDDPEQAVFLYQQVILSDPDFMRGQAKEFVKRQGERLKPARLARLLTNAEAAMQGGEWSRAEKLAQDMQALDAKNADAARIAKLCKANYPCEPIYKQAEVAAERGRWQGVKVLLADIREHCPDYGDPAGLFMQAMGQGSRIDIPMLEWCDIPAGEIVVEGTKYSLKPFQMAKYPVTNAQFRLFIDDPNGYHNPFWWNFSPEAKAWKQANQQPKDEEFSGDTRPRVHVTWYEAMAFCGWLNAMPGVGARHASPLQGIVLPTEAQWQWAAVGNTGWEYPWGATFDKNRCNSSESGFKQTTPVDRYPNGASPYGVMDMSGNVWEWCLNEQTLPNSINISGDAPRVLRGGSWQDSVNLTRAASRHRFALVIDNFSLGFRLVSSAPILK